MTEKDIIEFKLYNNRLFKSKVKQNFYLEQTKENLLHNKSVLKKEIKRIYGDKDA